MIEMWDAAFASLNPAIGTALAETDGSAAFELMHQELDKVWSGIIRVLKTGGWVCINVGDATRSIGSRFQLFSNHSRITQSLNRLGLHSLPVVLWRKQTNAPNKFMGSGMLPAGAYVTLEHEYVLIFRKGDKRTFDGDVPRRVRQMSSYFWEERNVWFSDIWDLKGTRQSLNHSNVRERSAAFPFELAYRLICMYSVRGDYVMDPLLGTGTTSCAAMATARNSIGVEIDPNFGPIVDSQISSAVDVANDQISSRLAAHVAFMSEYEAAHGSAKHRNTNYGFPVVTAQETSLVLNYVTTVERLPDGEYRAAYDERPHIREPRSEKLKQRRSGGSGSKEQLALI
jgi:DNA modification methylase